MANLQVMPVIKDGFTIGVKNAPSLIGAVILWILTIWIPYINVGTTIAICSIPVALSKGKVLSPTFIFGSQYRKQMGDVFILEGLSLMATYFAMLFLIIPAFVLSYSWSQALYLLLDKEYTPTEALTKSNKLTYGHKWTLFGIDILILLLVTVVIAILGYITLEIDTVFGCCVIAVLLLLIAPFTLGCHGVIYRQLTSEEPVEETIIEETIIEETVVE